MKLAANWFCLVVLALATSAAAANTADFENLTLAPGSFFVPAVPTTFSSGGASFTANPFDSWLYSNTTDLSDGSFNNAASAYHLPGGGGVDGSLNYGVAYDTSSFGPFAGPRPRVEFAGPVLSASAYLTNSTYTALSMLNGDGFAKQFGGVSGDDEDFLSLDIIGLNGATETGRVTFYLADYRFSNNALDYVVDSWTLVPLASLGVVDALEFQLSSSDSGDFGINTPGYFALDNLSFTPVPLPPAVFLLLLPLLSVLRQRRAN